MIPAPLVTAILKFVLPEVREILVPLFKYKDEPNELDVQMEDVGKKCSAIDLKIKAMEDMLIELDKDSHPEKPFEDRIAALEKKIAK